MRASFLNQGRDSGAVRSVLSGAESETLGAQVKTAPGTRSVNCESDSQGLARRYEGAPN